MSLRRLLVRSRPRFWFYLAGPVLVGLAYAADSAGELLSPTAVALFAYFLVPANVFLYGVNDVFDAAADRENERKAGREIRYRGDRLTPAAVLATGALGLALIAVVPLAAAPWIAGFLALGAAYSAPPARLKTRPPLDSLSNGLYALPGAAAYAALAGTSPPLLALVGGWCWTMAMHTFSAVPDIGPDRRAGVETTATALGERGALAYCGACFLFAAGAFAALHPAAGALLGLYPLLVAGVVAAEIDIERAYWWFPAINVAVGALLTLGGLWGIARA